MPTERDRQIVKRPLTPRVLEDIGIIERFPPAPKGFTIRGNWSQSYRIWLCHGYYGLLNLEGGYLRIERKTNGSGDEFTLSVEQTFLNWDGIVQTVKEEIHCRDDEIASPLRWEFSSSFHDANGNVMPKLSAGHTGRTEGNTVILDSNGVVTEKRATQRITADCCIFDAVQRLEPGSAAASFDMLELMTVLKTGQTIRRMDSRKDRPSFYSGELTRFVQTGRGVLPWEYWVDSGKRLVLATSGDRAYILDDNAEERFMREVAKHREGGYSWQNRL